MCDKFYDSDNDPCPQCGSENVIDQCPDCDSCDNCAHFCGECGMCTDCCTCLEEGE